MSGNRERKFSIFDVGRRRSSANLEMENLAKQMTNLEVSLGEPDNHRNTDEVVGDTVVIGIDGSKTADAAITWYLENLHRRENMLILVYALELPTGIAKDALESQIKIGKQKQEELRVRYLSKFEDLGIVGKFLSQLEKPGELIVSAAKKRGAAYIVMASRGFTRSRKAVIGNVSDFVIHNAECPVVMART